MAAALEKARRRWFQITPGRVVLGLLAVEAFLFLSERFDWFAFNHHKGWTVLIAIATVGLAMLLMFLWFLAALVFRLRFQFSLLSLFVLTVVVAVPCAWLKTEMNAAKKQREAVEWIKKLQRDVCYDYEPTPSPLLPSSAKPRTPAWLRRVLGNDLFADVTVAFLDGTKVIDEGLQHLEGLTQLKKLDLSGTTISNAGLEHLNGLPDLGLLYLVDTKVTDAGVKKLQQALPNCKIDH